MNKKTLSNIFKGDKVIWMIFFFLCIISVVEVFSASSGLTYKSGSYMYPLVKHLGILLMGIFCMVITLNIKCKYFKILTPFMLIISFFNLGFHRGTVNQRRTTLGKPHRNTVPTLGNCQGNARVGYRTDTQCTANRPWS